MEINIKNCNNIDSATISLSEGKLNIKFAPNGTGKSTIAKAMLYRSLGDDASLIGLKSFKHRDDPLGDTYPSVTGLENTRSVLCFNEEYVNQFTFKSEELISNSFNIFIRTDDYKATEQGIADHVLAIQEQFTNNPELESLISNLKELGGAFKVTTTGQLSKASTGMKALSVGNKIVHIPDGLEPYQPFIQSEKSLHWIDWQTKGHKEFSGLSDACPFCSTDSTGKKEQISKVSLEYDRKIIKNLVEVIDVVEKLGDYFSDETKEKLVAITILKTGIEKEHETLISNIKTQIDNFVEKLEVLRTLSGFHFKEGEKVAEKLPSYKLDLKFFPGLDSPTTQSAITPINSSIDDLARKAGELQGKINIQRKEIQKLIQKHQFDINNFLAHAGYRYKVEIIGEDGKSQLKLLHVDHKEHLIGGAQHLSFGERNAFSIVLFMYQCLADKPDLIILDDPISSFDKNKKYAILEMLFRRDSGSCLKGKTVMMLTHDVEPIIDTLKSAKKQFSNQVSASCLRYSKGLLVEKLVGEKDIKTFAQICRKIFISDCDDIIKLIYLRRHYEILEEKSDAYQVLSNLFHKRSVPYDSREPIAENDEYPAMDTEKIFNGTNEIKKLVAGFSYEIAIKRMLNREVLAALYQNCRNGYEKLQVFRLFGIEIKSSVMQKFINETYHIENELICQLDPEEFDIIPEYIVDECNKIIQV